LSRHKCPDDLEPAVADGGGDSAALSDADERVVAAREDMVIEDVPLEDRMTFREAFSEA